MVTLALLGGEPALAQTMGGQTAQGPDQPEGPTMRREEGKLVLSANVGVQTDYVSRGVSQTRGRPSVFAGAELAYEKVYAGAFASNVSYAGDPSTDAEVDFYAGVRPELAGWTLDLGVSAALFVGQPQGAGYDYVEIFAGASRSFGPIDIAGVVYLTPDFSGADERGAVYGEVNGAHRVSERVTVSAGLGYQQLSSDLDYATWNLGVTLIPVDRLSFDLRFSDTDRNDLGDSYGPRLALAVKRAF